MPGVVTEPKESPSAPEGPAGVWLLLAELNHRVANEYAFAMSSLSLAARSAAPAARPALIAARARLETYAAEHRALLAPVDSHADLSEYLARLCLCTVRARLAERGVALRFVAESFELPSEACWRVGLIVSELITNAVRHGLAGRGGLITVELRLTREGMDCSVCDSGGGSTFAPPGRGGRIVAGLARELGGHLNISFGEAGSCAVLSLPARADHRMGGG